MANTKLPSRLLDTSAVPALNVTGDLTVDTTTLVVDTTNNRVGIGNPSPTADLSVGSTSTSSGNVHLRTTKTAFSITPSNTNAGGILFDLGWVNGGQGPMEFGINSDVKMAIDSTGKVGIAEDGVIYASRFSVGKPHTHTPGSAFTNSPSSFYSEVQLGGTTGNDQKLVTFAGTDGSNVSGLALYRYRRATGTNWTTDGFSLRQEVDNTENIYDYINLAGGNVGIRNPSPAAKLDIKGDTTTYGGMAKIYLTDTASNSESRNWAIGNGGSGYGHFTIGRSSAKDGDPMASGTHTTPFVIDHQDNVGIGDNGSPAYTLEVKKDVAGDWISRIYNTNATTGYGALIRTDATSANDAIALGVYADSGYKMVVRSTGKVGIGVTSIGSNAHLQVNGGIRFNPFSAGHGLNVVSNQTFNNSNTSNSCGTVYYKCFIINIYHNNGHSQVFGIANGGGGVGFDFTIIRPDTATAIHGRPIDFSFTTIGSSPNTFRIQISSGGGALTVSRTSGTGSFSVQVHNIAGG